MKLRIKLLLPLVLASMAIIAYAYYSVLPNYLSQINEDNRLQQATHLDSVSYGIAPFLIENDLYSINSYLNTQFNKNTHWVSLELVDNDEKTLFKSQKIDYIKSSSMIMRN